MRQSLRVALVGGFASALFGLLPNLISPAHAQNEVVLNSSTVQVVHNTPANTVLNMRINVTGDGDFGGDCEGGRDDLLETGVHISVSKQTCAFRNANCPGILCAPLDFDAQVDYVEHDIGSASYGTSFAPNGPGSVSSKIVALATPANTCGTWSINLQGTGQNLSGITSAPVALFLNDSDNDGNSDSGDRHAST